MGEAGNPKAVVDSRGKVFGVSRLRIVDASVFPFLPPGHTQSTVCECRFPSTVMVTMFIGHIYCVLDSISRI